MALIYVTSNDNQDYFQGYLSGTARHGFTEVTRKIMFEREEDGIFLGQVLIRGVVLEVMKCSGNNDSWSIVGLAS